MSLPAELHAAAARQRDELLRFNLTLQTVLIDEALAALASEPTDETLRRLQCEWAAARRLLARCEPQKQVVR